MVNPLHPRMLCARFGGYWPSGPWEKDLSISSIDFLDFVIIFRWKTMWLFIWSPIHPRMFCAKFGWYRSNGSGEEVFKSCQLACEGRGSLKQVLTAPLFKARQQVWVSRVLGDDHYKWMSRVTVGVTRWRIINAQWPSVPGIPYVKIWNPSPVMVTTLYEWKILEWDLKPQTNKTNKQTNKRQGSQYNHSAPTFAISEYSSEIQSLNYICNHYWLDKIQ